MKYSLSLLIRRKQSTLPPILKQYTVKASKATQATSKTTRRRRETEILREAEEREKRSEKERQRKEVKNSVFQRIGLRINR